MSIRLNRVFRPFATVLLAGGIIFSSAAPARAGSLRAGTAVVDITLENPTDKISDPLLAKAIIFDNGATRLVILTVDVIAVGNLSLAGIGGLPDDFMTGVLNRIESGLGIDRTNILVNASHNHRTAGQICKDVIDKAFLAVRTASENMTEVRIGAGSGQENRIMMNRRLRLKNGREWTIRHANPCPPDDEVTEVGPVDPEIGILRVDRVEGGTLAVLYNFTVHPYTGIAGGGVTAELPGFASRVIENSLGEGTTAFFLQGAAGDITEILYKDVNSPRTPEHFGSMLGLSTLQALRQIHPGEDCDLRSISESLVLPLRTDIPERISRLEAEQAELVASLRGTSLNFKTFLPLYIRYSLDPEYPSYYSYRYLQEEQTGTEALKGMDAENRKSIEKYLRNIRAMEAIARIQENLYMLGQRQAEISAEGKGTKTIQIQVIKIGEFVLVTFPGELFARIGMDIKTASPFPYTFIASYSNGYYHYGPTAAAFEGMAYEDSNCLFAPEWEGLYRDKVEEMLRDLR